MPPRRLSGRGCGPDRAAVGRAGDDDSLAGICQLVHAGPVQGSARAVVRGCVDAGSRERPLQLRQQAGHEALAPYKHQVSPGFCAVSLLDHTRHASVHARCLHPASQTLLMATAKGVGMHALSTSKHAGHAHNLHARGRQHCQVHGQHLAQPCAQLHAGPRSIQARSQVWCPAALLAWLWLARTQSSRSGWSSR